MMRLIKALRDDRGVAAIEFAIIAPLLVGVLLLGVDGWLRINQVSQMRSAIQAGARYYQNGGSDDSGAAALAMRSWSTPPAHAQVNVVRSCLCGSTPVDCASLCVVGNTPPHAFVNLTATGTFTGLMGAEGLTEANVVRVR